MSENNVERINYIEEVVLVLEKFLKNDAFLILWNINFTTRLNSGKRQFLFIFRSLKRPFQELTIYSIPNLVLFC